MANLTGTGAPTRKTRGAVGDIYTDTKSGNKFKCTFAYRSNSEQDYDYEWKKGEKDDEVTGYETAKSQPQPEPENNQVDDADPVVGADEEPENDQVNDAEPEPNKKAEDVVDTPRKDYTAYSKKSK